MDYMGFLANSRPALSGYLELRRSLDAGRLPIDTRKWIGVLVSRAYDDDYCGVADGGVDVAQYAEEQLGQVLATFVEGLVYTHGRVADADIERLRQGGFTDDQIVEIVANVGLAMMERLLARAAGTARS